MKSIQTNLLGVRVEVEWLEEEHTERDYGTIRNVFMDHLGKVLYTVELEGYSSNESIGTLRNFAQENVTVNHFRYPDSGRIPTVSDESKIHLDPLVKCPMCGLKVHPNYIGRGGICGKCFENEEIG